MVILKVLICLHVNQQLNHLYLSLSFAFRASLNLAMYIVHIHSIQNIQISSIQALLEMPCD